MAQFKDLPVEIIAQISEYVLMPKHFTGFYTNSLGYHPDLTNTKSNFHTTERYLYNQNYYNTSENNIDNQLDDLNLANDNFLLFQCAQPVIYRVNKTFQAVVARLLWTKINLVANIDSWIHTSYISNIEGFEYRIGPRLNCITQLRLDTSKCINYQGHVLETLEMINPYSLPSLKQLETNIFPFFPTTPYKTNDTKDESTKPPNSIYARLDSWDIQVDLILHVDTQFCKLPQSIFTHPLVRKVNSLTLVFDKYWPDSVNIASHLIISTFTSLCRLAIEVHHIRDPVCKNILANIFEPLAKENAQTLVNIELSSGYRSKVKGAAVSNGFQRWRYPFIELLFRLQDVHSELDSTFSLHSILTPPSSVKQHQYKKTHSSSPFLGNVPTAYPSAEFLATITTLELGAFDNSFLTPDYTGVLDALLTTSPLLSILRIRHITTTEFEDTAATLVRFRVLEIGHIQLGPIRADRMALRHTLDPVMSGVDVFEIACLLQALFHSSHSVLRSVSLAVSFCSIIPFELLRRVAHSHPGLDLIAIEQPYMITDGGTQPVADVPLRVRSIPISIHRTPFTYNNPDTTSKVPTFNIFDAHIIARTLKGFSSSFSSSSGGVPINEFCSVVHDQKDLVAIAQPEFSTPPNPYSSINLTSPNNPNFSQPQYGYVTSDGGLDSYPINATQRKMVRFDMNALRKLAAPPADFGTEAAAMYQN